MKKILLATIILSLVSIAIFAHGQYGDGYIQECFVDGEFNLEEFLEHSPMVELLDTDGDGIVDGTDVSVEDFILARVENMQFAYNMPWHGQGMMGRGRRF